ncbi:Pet127-domain-containing protein [Gloeophyllum trabeum ATCC 11539]|uniref:Pet127-domain-containing protein n=1 Tax=Gloeophyllum trabeum (strain ATCC 11539 / FP-39264 / Madison 617) TaxID=670483 RepID=S7RJT1_GLOTA|nr:Pet127-domain-containing protein [Gloeophyllum trabeum ATCC 11539]EPQ54620.1 Pet127-domain-containing protein [Gloeophyllum trabeum ATCC 11539]
MEEDLDLEPISQQRPIAKLAHGLDRVLFDPGVHWLQEPRSQVYNFTPWLQNIPNVKDFAFERITGFVKSSRDEDLWGLARREDRGFAGSTSSLTGLLSHIYFLISGDREVDLSTCSRAFSNAPATFTPGQRMPASVMLNHRDGRYTIDSLSPFPGQSETNILTWLGHMLEKFLTASPSEFKKYLRSITPQHEEDPDDRREAYRYSKASLGLKNFGMVMRSQLDCVDKRLPGTGVFDLKTRAVLPIRMDRYNYEENSGYMIRSILGPRESFEKEYYDLVRSAFLKYSYQARIGNMDGILVAYHNTARIFGFQYMPLEDMEERLYGAPGRGERVFERCVSLLEVVLPEVTRCFPNQSVELMLEAQEGKGVLNIWVQPAGWNEEQDGPAPIVQLDVTARNPSLVRESKIKIRNAALILSTGSIRYSISHMALPDETVRRNRDAARERMFRAHSLPSGLDMGEMEDRWNNMFFGGEQASGQDKAPFNPSFFTEPDRFVQMLRKVARAGKEDLERMELAAHGKPKVVFGDYEPYEPLPRFAPADDIGDGAEGATRSEVSSPPSSHEGQLSSDRSSNVASGASPTPDLYRLDAAPGLEYASSGKAPVPHLTVQPHVVNLAPDFESATGEVNPESKLVPTSKLDTGSDRKQD